jgi:DNA-binding SARP family transcriptional activator
VGKKMGALLALLALSPGRLRSREEVIDLIWPEVDFDEARNRFKQILARLRKQLEPAGNCTDDFIKPVPLLGLLGSLAQGQATR